MDVLWMCSPGKKPEPQRDVSQWEVYLGSIWAVPEGSRKQKRNWWSRDDATWKERKHSLVNQVGCMQESWGLLLGLCKRFKHIFISSLSGRGRHHTFQSFCDALWVLSSVPAIRGVFADLRLSCFVRRHCIEVISSFMLSSSEGYGSLIQHATLLLPAGWATGPNVFYHHGALGLCSPNLSTGAANMTNWCGATGIVFHSSTLADCVSAEGPVFV